jgi:restriction endonuclease S subunit
MVLADFKKFDRSLAGEQQEIVRRVEGLFALADQLEERLAEALGQVEKLTPSLLVLLCYV